MALHIRIALLTAALTLAVLLPGQSLAQDVLLPIGVGKGYARTVVVHPAPGYDLISGTRLLNALAEVTNPGPDNPWLIKLEPGVYYLNEETLHLPAYVSLKGASRKDTYIMGRGGITLTMEGESTIRQVGILNIASATEGLAVQMAGEALFQSVALSTGNGSFLVLQENASLWMQDCDLHASRTDSNLATGMLIQANADAHLTRCSLSLGPVSSTGIGIETLMGSTLKLDSCDITLNSMASVGLGLRLGSGSHSLIDCTIAVDAAQDSFGVFSNGITELQGCTISLPSGQSRYGVHLDTEGRATLRHCVVNETSATSVNMAVGAEITILDGELGNAEVVEGASLHAAGTHILGALSGSGEIVCAGVTDASFTFYPSSCP